MRKKVRLEILKEVSENVRKFRHFLNITQEELAQRVECHVNHIARIERGQTDMSISMLYRISKALKISTVDLFLVLDIPFRIQLSEDKRKKSASLNEHQVMLIRRVFKKGISITELAEIYNVTPQTIQACLIDNLLC